MDVCDECGAKIKNYVFLKHGCRTFEFCSEFCLRDFIEEGKLLEKLTEGGCCGN